MEKFNQVALTLARKIKNKKARIGIIGLGYVGLPLAVEFARAGFRVSGIDLDQSKVGQINRGISYVQDITSKTLRPLIQKRALAAHSDVRELQNCDAIVICVPTPLNKVRDPDLSCVLEAVRAVRKSLKRGQLIVLESTTYPGTTEELVLPEIAKNGFRVGSDFFLCFSPERIDPGNREFPLHKIPKVLGGVTAACSKMGRQLYRSIIQNVVLVSSPRVAEMTKLLENTFRIVNIGLVNELITVANALKINLWEAIDAAKTKPFGYMPFYPGPGIGGHCIGIDPLYLAWKARLTGSELRFVALASQVNAAMPSYVVQRALHLLNQKAIPVRGARILILGASYKKDVADTRESPALEIMEELCKLGAEVRYHDPLVKRIKLPSAVLESTTLNRSVLKRQHLVILLVLHSAMNRSLIARHSRLILDTRNALGKGFGGKGNISLL